MTFCDEDLIRQFRSDGCVPLGQLLDADDVRDWRARFEHCRHAFSTCWRSHGAYATLTADPLVIDPRFDRLVRHPRVVEMVSSLLGGEARFWETSLRHIAPAQQAWPDGWHQDNPRPQHWVQAMLYLTDTGPDTHCVRVIPRGAEEPRLGWEEELARRGRRDCLGPAGSMWLFNPSCWHTACVRGAVERLSIQTYYCLEERPVDPVASAHSAVPRQLWDGPDAAANRFYALAPQGQRTALMRDAFAPSADGSASR